MKRSIEILGSKARQADLARRLILVACSVVACTALGACGQKGPLYLPSPGQGDSSTSPSSK